jgi:hypothetical protein
MAKDANTRSIAELEGIEWAISEVDAGPMHRRCMRLRKIPISSLSPGDLRVLIGQDIGLVFLMPLAIEMLERSPLMEAEYFNGDLLCVVLGVEAGFYRKHPSMTARVKKLLDFVPSELEKLDQINFDTASEALDEAIAEFNAKG